MVGGRTPISLKFVMRITAVNLKLCITIHMLERELIIKGENAMKAPLKLNGIGILHVKPKSGLTNLLLKTLLNMIQIFFQAKERIWQKQQQTVDHGSLHQKNGGMMMKFLIMTFLKVVKRRVLTVHINT